MRFRTVRKPKHAPRSDYYKHIFSAEGGKNTPRWRGLRVIKYPADLVLYAQAIFKKRPTLIIETGTYLGGSANFFGDMLTLIGGGRVITIDGHSILNHPWITCGKEPLPDPHPNVQYILGSSIGEPVLAFLKETITDSDRVMVVLDSNHLIEHVEQELELYSPLVTLGQYLVVEDCYCDTNYEPNEPYYAVDAFLKTHQGFSLEPVEEQFVYAVTRGGWLYKNGVSTK